ncbi:MAG TPA: MFS transporter [Pseudogracilibacillus sp.]|nr:MFS transporter [Pseudogracilibacillus sp.]
MTGHFFGHEFFKSYSILFFFVNQRSKDPFIDVHILQNASYRKILVMSFLNTIAYMGILFIAPLMLTEVNDLSANWIGLVLFPGAVFTTILGGKIGKLIGKKGSLFVNQLSFLMMIIACLALSSLVGVSPIWICLLLVPVFLGFTANQTSFSSYISQIVPANQNGIAMGLFTLMTFLASAIGIALFSRFLELDMGHWNVLNQSSFSSYSNVLLITAIVGVLAIGVLIAERKHQQTNERHLHFNH